MFLLVSVRDGAVLGIHGAAADNAHDLWGLLHNEGALCQVLFGSMPELPGEGIWCACAVIADLGTDTARAYAGAAARQGFCPAGDSPAPLWRRPTLDEVIAVITGATPPNITAWINGE